MVTDEVAKIIKLTKGSEDFNTTIPGDIYGMFTQFPNGRTSDESCVLMQSPKGIGGTHIAILNIQDDIQLSIVYSGSN